MHLLYLIFGNNLQNHTQAYFSMLSFMAKNEGVASINIITDTPQMYQLVSDRVNVITINQQTLQQWRGEHDFFWRIKIKAIEHMCMLYKNEPVMYLDTDTFLYSSLQIIAQQPRPSVAFMHLNEGPLAGDKSKTGKKMWQQTGNKTFGGISITPAHAMWNAGVVYTPNQQQLQECSLALAICDQMCQQGVTRRLIEQFALSVALQETYGLRNADECIAHYWSNKDGWNTIINAFFMTAYIQQTPHTALLQIMRQFNFSQQPVGLTTRNTNTRLKKLVDKMYPPHAPIFVTNQFHNN